MNSLFRFLVIAALLPAMAAAQTDAEAELPVISFYVVKPAISNHAIQAHKALPSATCHPGTNLRVCAYAGAPGRSTHALFVHGTTGRVGIGIETPAAKLHVGGDTITEGNFLAEGDIITEGAFLEVSDVRFKDNIETLSSALDKVTRLRGVNFEWRMDTDKDFNEGLQLGLIAQEVEAVVPELVHTGSDGYKAVAYSNMSALLVEAIKEQQALIEAQQAQQAQHEAELEALKAELQQLRNSLN
jgi:hypothetical protein